MNKILITILSLFACLSAFSQSPIVAKDLSFPATGTTRINKWSQDIYTADSLCVTCVPSTNAVYKYVRDHVTQGTGPGGSYYTKIQVDSIVATFVSDTLKAITTTNATPTNFDTIKLANNTAVMVDVKIMFHNTSVKQDAGKAHRELFIRNVGGVIYVDDGVLDNTGNDLIGYDHAYGTVGGVTINLIQLAGAGNICFQVTGISGTINWTLQRHIDYHTLN